MFQPPSCPTAVGEFRSPLKPSHRAFYYTVARTQSGKMSMPGKLSGLLKDLQKDDWC